MLAAFFQQRVGHRPVLKSEVTTRRSTIIQFLILSENSAVGDGNVISPAGRAAGRGHGHAHAEAGKKCIPGGAILHSTIHFIYKHCCRADKFGYATRARVRRAPAGRRRGPRLVDAVFLATVEQYRDKDRRRASWQTDRQFTI